MAKIMILSNFNGLPYIDAIVAMLNACMTKVRSQDLIMDDNAWLHTLQTTSKPAICGHAKM